MSETKRNLSDFFVEEKLRGQQKSQLQQARFVRESRKDPETDGSKIVQAREGFAEYFSAGLQIGRSQLESDIKRSRTNVVLPEPLGPKILIIII